MKGYKACGQGHFYSESQSECPYCPKGAMPNDTSGGKTEVMGGAGANSATELVNPSSGTQGMDSNKTQVFSPSEGDTVKVELGSSSQDFDANRTIIGGSENSTNNEDVNTVIRRKLRGWLVTFDIEEFGLDFRIIEGRNSIGSSPKNDITIQDPKSSSEHAMILYRSEEFLITDEMSSNGTLLNGEDITPRQPYPLKDGDVIRIGTTTLLFKTAFRK